jgi:hypothetical protein
MPQHQEVIAITPDLAKKWLGDPYERQRSLSPTTIAKYARAMVENRWFEPALDPIAFTAEGKLLNGQHRLLALIKADMTIEMIVAYDVDPAIFDIIDTGRRRGAYQFIRGGNATERASIARMIMWYDRRRAADPKHLIHPIGTYALSFDNDEILEMVEGPIGDLIAASGLDAHRVQSRARVPVATHGAVLTIARRDGASEPMIGDWIDGVGYGAGLDRMDPRLLLRNRMLDPIHGQHTRRSVAAAWMLITRAFNAYAQGRSMRSLVYVASDPPPAVDALGTANPNQPGRPRQYKVREVLAEAAGK